MATRTCHGNVLLSRVAGRLAESAFHGMLHRPKGRVTMTIARLIAGREQQIVHCQARETVGDAA
jgi:hypothetical protein